MPPTMAFHASSSRGFPPLPEMVDSFRRDLGMRNETVAGVVHGAAQQLGLDVSDGKTLIELAKECWQLIYGTTAEEIPMGGAVSDDDALAMALSASTAPPNQTKEPVVPLGIPTIRDLECSVCFDDLTDDVCAVFFRGAKRICSHTFHHRCVLELHDKTCPMCRAQYDEARPLPKLHDDPAAWVDCVDVGGTRKLTQQDVLATLLAQHSLDAAAATAALQAHWTDLRPDAAGQVGTDRCASTLPAILNQLLGHGGAAEGALAAPPTLARSVSTGAPIPDIHRHPDAWFAHFDEAGNGALAPEEVVRGLIKTFGLSTDLSQISNTRELVHNIWPAFAEPGETTISRAKFKEANGLAEAIVAQIGSLAGEFARLQPPGPGRAASHPGPDAPLELPDGIKACPACGMLIEKIDGDHQVMCGCEARPAGGTLEKALANGGCGHEFNFNTLAPLGCGKPGEPANDRQVLFRPRR